MPEHDLEQIRGALAQLQFEEHALNFREALELTDRFYAGDIATSPQSGDSAELAVGYFSLGVSFSRIDPYGSGRY
jgi:hypothetical protein